MLIVVIRWVPLMHDSTYAGEMLLRAKLQGVDTWKNCEKGPASEAAFNLPFNGAPDVSWNARFEILVGPLCSGWWGRPVMRAAVFALSVQHF